MFLRNSLSKKTIQRDITKVNISNVFLHAATWQQDNRVDTSGGREQLHTGRCRRQPRSIRTQATARLVEVRLVLIPAHRRRQRRRRERPLPDKHNERRPSPDRREPWHVAVGRRTTRHQYRHAARVGRHQSTRRDRLQGDVTATSRPTGARERRRRERVRSAGLGSADDPVQRHGGWTGAGRFVPVQRHQLTEPFSRRRLPRRRQVRRQRPAHTRRQRAPDGPPGGARVADVIQPERFRPRHAVRPCHVRADGAAASRSPDTRRP